MVKAVHIIHCYDNILYVTNKKDDNNEVWIMLDTENECVYPCNGASEDCYLMNEDGNFIREDSIYYTPKCRDMLLERIKKGNPKLKAR